jgi:hypothetical protein
MAQATVQLSGAVQTVQLNPKQFKTGSDGYHGHGKLQANGEKYQVNIIIVRIGSKK